MCLSALDVSRLLRSEYLILIFTFFIGVPTCDILAYFDAQLLNYIITFVGPVDVVVAEVQ